LEKNYFTSTNNQEKTLIAFQKLNLLLLNNIQDEQSIIEIDRIESEYLSSSDQLIFFWNASLINYINKNNSKAVYWFERYQESSMDSSNETFLLSALIYSDYNSEKFNVSLVELAKRDSIFNCLSCLKKEKKSNEKNKKIKIISSSIIPGLGMMLNGDVIKGITSTVLNASSIVLTNYLILNKSYFNALGWGFSLWLKFYTGNLKLTEKLIDKKQNNKLNEELNHCKIYWMKLLENYPIKIKQ
jgi:TM2 domain-containing membrane protein YozV